MPDQSDESRQGEVLAGRTSDRLKYPASRDGDPSGLLLLHTRNDLIHLLVMRLLAVWRGPRGHQQHQVAGNAINAEGDIRWAVLVLARPTQERHRVRN
jgi:hypothetical protein